MQGLSSRISLPVRRSQLVLHRSIHPHCRPSTWPTRCFLPHRSSSLSSIAAIVVSNGLRSSTFPNTRSSTLIHSNATYEPRVHTPEIHLHTPAYLSRVASQTVRFACEQHSLAEAYAVVKSLHHSQRPLRLGPSKSIAVEFGQAVSPRLASHCLLHGLIRLGLTKKAGKLAYQMLKMGTSVRSKSLELTVSRLCETDASAIKELRPSFTASYSVHKPPPNSFTPSMVQSPHTRLAMQIFMAAKQHKHQRTKRMLQSLIDACLLQGEILVVSFLFAFLLKQWQVRLAVEGGAQPLESPQSDAFPVDGTLRTMLDMGHTKMGTGHYPLPDDRMMNQVVAHIGASIHRKTPKPEGSVYSSPRDATQSLSVLGELLCKGLLPFVSVSSLIKSLYNLPTPPCKIWVRRRKVWQLDSAPETFQRTLEKVIHRFLSQNDIRKPPDKGLQHRMIGLDRRSLNSLVHYAFRYQRSPAIAETIVQNMAKQNDASLWPNTVTMNIVLRSGTILHINDIAMKAVHALQLPVKPMTSDSSLSNTYSMDVQLQADVATLTSYISFLVVSGKPEVVERVCFSLFPELDPSHQKFKNSTFSRDNVERAVWYGPRFFAAALHGLRKSRKIIRAAHLWRLAKEAERLSWTMEGATPWCLPVHAYTIMMQCYAIESRQRWMTRHGSGIRHAISPGALRSHIRAIGILEADNTNLRGLALDSKMAAQLMGRQLYRSMLLTAEAAKNVHRLTCYPIPDARFFNAALSLFGIPNRGRKSCKSLPRSQWRRLVRRAHCRYVSFGETSPGYSAFIVTILKGIQSNGFKVPMAYRSVLVGKEAPRWGSHWHISRKRSPSMRNPRNVVPHILHIPPSRLSHKGGRRWRRRRRPPKSPAIVRS